MPEPRSVILDCDPGLDDAVALAMLAASPELDLLGVTTLAGNVSLEHTTANAGGLLELFEMPDELPFHAGYAGPLARVQREPDEPIHGPGGMGDIELPEPRLPAEGHAVDWLATTIRERPGEVTIIAIGPLTNVAGLLLQHPDVVPLIAGVTLMGGAAFVQGNLTASAEFNFHADPEAARYVAESGVPLQIVPLDVTRSALVTGEDIDRLRAAGGIAALMGDMLAYLSRGFERRHGVRACAVHDALAVAALLEPQLMVWEQAAVTVECSGEFTRGELIVDTHGRLGRPASAAVATGINAEEFRSLLHRRLLAASH